MFPKCRNIYLGIINIVLVSFHVGICHADLFCRLTLRIREISVPTISESCQIIQNWRLADNSDRNLKLDTRRSMAGLMARILAVTIIAANIVLSVQIFTVYNEAHAATSDKASSNALSTTATDNSTSKTKGKNIDMLANPEFIILDNQSRVATTGLISFWGDSLKQCGHIFTCTNNYTTGWKDKTSLQLSTTRSDNKTWSYITGKEIDVRPNEQYEFVTHMKLNEFARESQILVEGFNESSEDWYEITPSCPEVTNGPLEWHEFRCEITIPQDITQIRPVLYAGYSSQKNKDAVTLFDSLYLIKLNGPILTDAHLKTELVYKGLDRPVSMAFLGPDDILVLENHKGTVQRIVNGVRLERPLLDVNVAVHDGLLGVAVAKNVTINGLHPRTYVFLYFTEAKNQDHEDDNNTIGNRLYRYELSENGTKLVNPKLLLNLPFGATHNGGPVTIGPDNNVYIAVGELSYADRQPPLKNKAINYNNGFDPDGVSGILRVTMDGKVVGGILGYTWPLNLYYGYGIRNSFGMDFDPITKKLWITDNGPDFGDEIDLVEPGFNGGWAYISGTMRMANDSNYADYPLPLGLVDFNGKGKYSAPKFTWNHTIGPTALKFLNSDKYGKEYENDIFVGEVNNGRIYHFDLNQNRTELTLPSSITDKIATTDDQLQSLIFAKGFRSVLPDVTDLDVGPDGYLYVVAMNEGKIFKIVPGQPNDDPYKLESFMHSLTSLPGEQSNGNIKFNDKR